MKQTILTLVTALFLLGCVDKKAEEKKKAEFEAQIEAVDQEAGQKVESLEKEAQEIDNAINELDNL